jgi:soluble lytic murein transglycosylase-like protein
MTNPPFIRSAALQRALSAATGKSALPAIPPARLPRGAQRNVGFASTLARAQAKPAARTTAVASAPIGSGPVPFAAQIEAAARKYGVDPALLAGLVKAESNFNPNAQSGAGAKGLTQLMPATARGLGVTNSFDPAQALDGGAKFLGGLLKQFKGDERLALAAYNAGPGAVQKFGGIPPYEETQRYVPKVLGFATQFRRIWADPNGG